MTKEEIDLKKFYHNDLTDKEFKTLEDFRSIQQEQKAIDEKFEKALQLAKDEVETLTTEVAELEQTSQDIYTSFVIGDVDASAYQEITKELESKRELLTLAKSKVANIDTVKVSELAEKIMPKINKIRPAYQKIVSKQQSLVKRDLMNAKAEYLKAIKNGLRQDDNLAGLSTFSEGVRYEIGERHNIYYNSTPTANKYVSNEYYGTKGIDVSKASLGANN